MTGLVWVTRLTLSVRSSQPIIWRPKACRGSGSSTFICFYQFKTVDPEYMLDGIAIMGGPLSFTMGRLGTLIVPGLA